MAQLRTIADVLKIAIKREALACEFYRELAAATPERELSELILLMAQEELEHKSTLELELMKQGVVTRAVPQEVRLTLDHSQSESDSPGGLDYTDLMLLAIEKERTSFRLYALLASVPDDPDLQDVLLAVAEEEAKHIVRFEQAYREATSSRG